MTRAGWLARITTVFVALTVGASACGADAPAEPTGELLLHRGTTRQPPQLIVHDLASGDERVVAPAPAATGQWSADGRRIAYTHDDGTGVEIRVVDGAGGFATTISAPDAEAVPAWSPDCSQIAFARFDLENDRSAIWMMDADGSNRRQVTTGAGLDTAVDWSPDGDRLVFMSDRGGDAEIVTIDLDTGDETQLTDNTVGDTWPRWSPDGERLAFARRVNERKQIFVVDASGENEVQLTTGARGGEFPVWSPDGHWLAYEQAGSNVTIMRADGTERSELDLAGVPTDWGPKTGSCG